MPSVSGALSMHSGARAEPWHPRRHFRLERAGGAQRRLVEEAGWPLPPCPSPLPPPNRYGGGAAPPPRTGSGRGGRDRGRFLRSVTPQLGVMAATVRSVGGRGPGRGGGAVSLRWALGATEQRDGSFPGERGGEGRPVAAPEPLAQPWPGQLAAA